MKSEGRLRKSSCIHLLLKTGCDHLDTLVNLFLKHTNMPLKIKKKKTSFLRSCKQKRKK